MQKGFALIELLVVVLIIGILASVALPQYELAVAKARLTEAYSLGRVIGQAQEAYKMANGSYTTDFTQLDFDSPCPIVSKPGKQNNAVQCAHFEFQLPDDRHLFIPANKGGYWLDLVYPGKWACGYDDKKSSMGPRLCRSLAGEGCNSAWCAIK